MDNKIKVGLLEDLSRKMVDTAISNSIVVVVVVIVVVVVCVCAVVGGVQ